MKNHKYTDEEVQRALDYDALAEAEKITGNSYREPSTGFLGMSLMKKSGEAKKTILENRNDVHFNIGLEEYEEVIKDIGFLKCVDIIFTCKKYNDLDHFKIWVEPDRAILLAYDTWNNKKINGGNLYYNVKPNEVPTEDGGFPTLSWGCISSGHYTENGIWVGNHDCREAVRFAIEKFERHGEFVSPWIEQPHLWLRHYGDKNLNEAGRTSFAIDAKERLKLLPEEYQKLFQV